MGNHYWKLILLSFYFLSHFIHNLFVLQSHVQISILLLVFFIYTFTCTQCAKFCYNFFSCSWSLFLPFFPFLNHTRFLVRMLFFFFCGDISLFKMLTAEYTFLHADLFVLNNVNEWMRDSLIQNLALVLWMRMYFPMMPTSFFL